MYDIEKRIIALETRLNQTVRVGEIASINAATGTARVILPDSGGVVSHDLPVLFQKAHHDKFYTMPDVGEQVLCVFLPNGLEQGFILGAMFSQIVSPPVNSPDKTHFKFKDGTVLEYDRAAHLLTVDVKGNVVLKATGTVTAIAASFNLTGPLSVSGNISATGNVAAGGTVSDAGGNTNHHSH